jgi:hypothetical protein
VQLVLQPVLHHCRSIAWSFLEKLAFGLPMEAVSVNSSGAISDQKTSKFFGSHLEESIAGHVGVSGVNGVY